ncbi:MAG: CapA family protein [Acidiferrobacterales bacterium]
MNQAANDPSSDSNLITLSLSGDVMTGRGIDQVLPHPSHPRIYEPYVKTAIRYVELAELMSGQFSKPVNFSYIWGNALEEFERGAADLRIINLETAITKSDDYWKGKGINYRMHPKNIPCITAAKIDCCVLSNNHVLDWGYSGLAETLETLKRVKVKSAGAGRNIAEAETPAVLEVPGKGRVIVFGFGSESSGIPWHWRATESKAGVNLLKDLSNETIRDVTVQVQAIKQEGDILVASIHWGANWGYEILREETTFAHKLIDEAGVDVIHGHSSHHPKGIEIYRDRPIIYGCGDFLNDYEGISGYEEFRDDLGLMYFVTVDPLTGKLFRFEMTPIQIKQFQVNRASKADAQWLKETLSRECAKLGTRVELTKEDRLSLQWVGSGG